MALMWLCICRSLLFHQLSDFMCKLLDHALQPEIIMHAWLALQGAHSSMESKLCSHLPMLRETHLDRCLGSLPGNR